MNIKLNLKGILGPKIENKFGSRGTHFLKPKLSECYPNICLEELFGSGGGI